MVLVHSRKKVLHQKNHSLHTLDLVQEHSLEPTSSVRLHKVQSSVLRVKSPYLVVQMRHLSLQLLITQFSLISLELVLKVESYFLILKRLLLDLLVLFLVSLSLLVVETNLIQSSSILLVRQQMSYLLRTTRIQICSISLEGCDRVHLFILLLGYRLLEIKKQKKSIGVLLLLLQLSLTKIGDQSIQTTRLFPSRQRTGDSYSQTSTIFRLVVNTTPTEKLHSLLEKLHFPDRLLDLQEQQRSYFQKISTLQLQSITSPLENLVLLHTMLVYSYLENSGYHRLHNTQYSVKKVSLLLVVLVTSLLHQSYQKDLVHSSRLVVR